MDRDTFEPWDAALLFETAGLVIFENAGDGPRLRVKLTMRDDTLLKLLRDQLDLGNVSGTTWSATASQARVFLRLVRPHIRSRDLLARIDDKLAMDTLLVKPRPLRAKLAARYGELQ